MMSSVNTIDRILKCECIFQGNRCHQCSGSGDPALYVSQLLRFWKKTWKGQAYYYQISKQDDKMTTTRVQATTQQQMQLNQQQHQQQIFGAIEFYFTMTGLAPLLPLPCWMMMSSVNTSDRILWYKHFRGNKCYQCSGIGDPALHVNQLLRYLVVKWRC